MKRFGSPQVGNKTMDDHHLFLMRLHLLIVMVKATLKGYPGGDFRKNAALDTAALIFKAIPDINFSFLGSRASSHLFTERVKLLSVMATAIISEDYPLGVHRREAVLDNIEVISQTAFPSQELFLFHDVLMAA
jgi:hypothetical protein